MRHTQKYETGGGELSAEQRPGAAGAALCIGTGYVRITPEDLRAFATEVLELWPAPRYRAEPQHHGLTWRVYDTEMDMAAAHFTQAHPTPEAAARAEADCLNESN